MARERSRGPRPPAAPRGQAKAKAASDARRSAPAQRRAPGDPRAAALELLAGVREGASLDDQITAGLLDGLPPEDRARAQRLAASTLRLRGRAEAVLAPLMQRRPRPAVGDLLALAVTEMLALGAPPHGVVSAAVDLARRQGQKGAAAAGMVNAVLRRAAAAQAEWDAAPPARLPDWLRAPVAADWGEAATVAIEAAHEAGAPLDLTLKSGPLRDDPSQPVSPRAAETPAAGAGADDPRQPARHGAGERTDAPAHGDPSPRSLPAADRLPTGSLRLPAGPQVTTLPGYAAGDWWVQDAAAALAVRVLAPQPGETIADLCAAPGGKTLQLAAAGARVTAVEIAPARARRLSENLARCGLAAEVVIADALDWRPEAAFDAILLDAPCSATGTIRRHPELPLIRDGSGTAALSALQAALLDRALGLLRPGGRLVYATCSLLRAEGEAQVEAALNRHPGLTVEPPDAAGLGVEPGWITPEGGLRLRPDYWAGRGSMDGFYIARLRLG